MFFRDYKNRGYIMLMNVVSIVNGAEKATQNWADTTP